MRFLSTRIRALFRLDRAGERDSRTAPARVDEIAREAIRVIHNAEIDLDRCGQIGLARVYRDRAAALEQALRSAASGEVAADARLAGERPSGNGRTPHP